MWTELVMHAFDQAVWRRNTPLDDLVVHYDARSQYTAIRFTERLGEIGVRPSIGTVDDSYDNAMAETTIGLYKTELVWQQGPWRSVEQLELATFMYVEWFNKHRLQGELDDNTPAEYEQIYYLQHQTQIAAP